MDTKRLISLAKHFIPLQTPAIRKKVLLAKCIIVELANAHVHRCASISSVALDEITKISPANRNERIEENQAQKKTIK